MNISISISMIFAFAENDVYGKSLQPCAWFDMFGEY